MLSLYNTASRSVEPIEPLVPGKIGMYCCGPTVYQRAHIGNLRAYVFEDVLRRTLESIEGMQVRHVMNITDVGHLVGDEDEGEDKMEKSSRETGKNAWEIAKEFEALFFQDIQRLNIESPTSAPRATDHIAEQIELIKTLEEKGFTYQISDGLYFDTSKLPSYGKLSRQILQEKQEGARVQINKEKRNPSDFALWKFSHPTDLPTYRLTDSFKRQMEWPSPWGIGFPGWHVECSAMSRKELGQPFDIHCGGIDHIPVHHENEIAQSEAAYGVPFVKYWMHVEFLMVEGQKMSKSLNNTFTLDDLTAAGIDPRALRLFFLGASYHSKQNFTWEAIKGVQIAFAKLERAVRSWKEPENGLSAYEERFRSAMENDLNTPEALAVMWEMIDSDHDTASKSASFAFMDKMLGLGLSDLIGKTVLIPVEIKRLADERWSARTSGDWTKSDALRDELAKQGWNVNDGKGGYTLEKV
ncbi:MAG: cysteine--tRNA ligase [Patescibacteria group bacterium]